MATIFRLTGADFAGKGLPNLFPFVAKADLEYGFDFRDRASKMVDLAGKHSVTPYRNDIVLSNFSADPTVVSSADGGLGITVEQGYLRSSVPATTFALDGTKQFTVMVVGGYSGLAFPPDKVATAAATACNLFDYGSLVSGSGLAIDLSAAGSAVMARIESPGDAFAGHTSSMPLPTSKTVTFLTFDGANWSFHNKTNKTKHTATSAALSVNNPIQVTAVSSTAFKVSLGGFAHRTSTLHALAPTLYQQAMWNRVLSDGEIEAQYQQTKGSFGAVGV